MATFLLIRHGLTDDVGLRLSGRAPGIHLNAEGREQAAALAAALEGPHANARFGAAWGSDSDPSHHWDLTQTADLCDQERVGPR